MPSLLRRLDLQALPEACLRDLRDPCRDADLRRVPRDGDVGDRGEQGTGERLKGHVVRWDMRRWQADMKRTDIPWK